MTLNLDRGISYLQERNPIRSLTYWGEAGNGENQNEALGL